MELDDKGIQISYKASSSLSKKEIDPLVIYSTPFIIDKLQDEIVKSMNVTCAFIINNPSPGIQKKKLGII